MARVVHGKLSKSCQLERKEKWFEYVPEGVVEKNEVKMLWDMNIQCDNYKVIKAGAKNMDVRYLIS